MSYDRMFLSHIKCVFLNKTQVNWYDPVQGELLRMKHVCTVSLSPLLLFNQYHAYINTKERERLSQMHTHKQTRRLDDALGHWRRMLSTNERERDDIRVL